MTKMVFIAINLFETKISEVQSQRTLQKVKAPKEYRSKKTQKKRNNDIHILKSAF